MEFASDNTSPAHPGVLEALGRASAGHAPGYGADALTEAAVARVRAVFEAPGAAVYFVALGTAANALALATLGAPWQTVFCADEAHVQMDECGAPEFFGGGTKLTLVPAPAGRMTPETLAATIAPVGRLGVHGVQPGPVTLTQATEFGTLYSVSDIAALAAVAHDAGLPLHMDGARFANAVARLGCTPAEMTWRAGVDAVSFGGTKNGLLGVEAVIFFDPATAWEFELRRKRAGHLFSKMRYLSAQMDAYLADGLWLDLAARANAACDRLAAGLARADGVEILYPPEANMVFVRMARARHTALHAAGARYYLWDGDGDDAPDTPVTGRLVCGWTTTDAEVDAFLATL